MFTTRITTAFNIIIQYIADHLTFVNSPLEMALSVTDTNLVSSIERGDDDEPTQAYYQYVEECEEEATKLYD